MPDYSRYPGCFVYIRLMVVKDRSDDQLAVRFSTVARSEDETTPVVSLYERGGDINLPANDSRPFGFGLAYDMGDSNNPTLPSGDAKYSWDTSNLWQNIKIWEVGTPEPDFGTALPLDFVALKAHGGLLTFIDSNGSDGKAFNYCVRLMQTGSPGVYLEPLDPRITNSTNN